MKVHQDVQLKAKTFTSDQVIEILKKFTLETSIWSFLKDQSEEYARLTNSPSCIIQLDEGHTYPAFAITCNSNGICEIANIVPLKTGQILMPEYNRLSMKFVKDFRSFVRKNKIKISIHLSKEDIGLDTIISNSKARKLFEIYLSTFSKSYHLNDVKRLDVFTCAVSRLRSKKIDLYLLKGYLIEDLNWTSKDAEWCYDRIEIGLDVLEVNKNIY
ncbi:MAG: hypothetical protein DCF20_03355 [Pseudanabaena sp.]|nr:MAG: hypothetical protein DCF20_03355 [Pseudanabaena sp.]